MGKICSNLEANISNLEVSYLYPLKEDKKADKKADKKEDKKADNSSAFRLFLRAFAEGVFSGLG